MIISFPILILVTQKFYINIPLKCSHKKVLLEGIIKNKVVSNPNVDVLPRETNELIKRAVLSIQSARVQPQGTYTNAGRDYTARYRGMRRLGNMHRTINVGVARKPRLKNRRYLLQGNVATIPGTVGGPRAHPIKTEKTIAEKINKKDLIFLKV